MITPKHTRCEAFTLLYIARYAPVRAEEIPAGATYSRTEIAQALARLERDGAIAQDEHGRWVAVTL